MLHRSTSAAAKAPFTGLRPDCLAEGLGGTERITDISCSNGHEYYSIGETSESSDEGRRRIPAGVLLSQGKRWNCWYKQAIRFGDDQDVSWARAIPYST